MSKLSEVKILEPLSVEEESERLRLERKVERAFYEAGLALSTLRNKRLWRSTHYSFQEYLQDRFCYSRDYAYKLIDAVEISQNIYGVDNPLVDNCLQNKTLVLATAESQLRPLKRLKEPEKQRQVWITAVKEAGGKVPTAALVREIVDRVQPKKTKNQENVTTPVEGPNRIPGAGLDWYVRVDEETFKALDTHARENGIPTLGLAVRRLLEQVEK